MRVPTGRPHSRTWTNLPPLTKISVPASRSAGRVCSSKRATLAIDGNASPRNPNVFKRSRSAASAILLVACRSSASRASSRVMPWPLSSIRMSARPPWRNSTSMRVAPASRAFSTSSFTTAAGRSITSPAAIWLATRSERMRTVAIVAQGYLRSEREGTTSRTIPLASIRLTR